MSKQNIATTFWRKSKFRAATGYNLKWSVFNTNKNIIRNAKKQENVTNIWGWAAFRGLQKLDLVVKDFKAAIRNMIKELKGSRTIISQQVKSLNEEEKSCKRTKGRFETAGESVNL